MTHQYLSRIENMLDPMGNILLNMDYAEAEKRVLSGDEKLVGGIDGQFAIMVASGKTVRMARSIGRPLRYFLAKLVDGPCLIVAERMDEIVKRLTEMGIADQFHPSYTRMVPAHHKFKSSCWAVLIPIPSTNGSSPPNAIHSQRTSGSLANNTLPDFHKNAIGGSIRSQLRNLSESCFLVVSTPVLC